MPSLSLPDECADPQVLSLALAERAKAMGNCLQAVKNEPIGKSGEIDWLVIGVYQFDFDAKGERITKAVHVPTGDKVATPSRLLINTDFSLESNWSDARACFVLGNTKLNIAGLFSVGAGPNKSKVLQGKSVVFSQLVKQVLAPLEKKTQDANKGDLRVSDVKAEAKQKAIRSARVAMNAKQAELNSTRRLNVGKRVAKAEAEEE